MLAGQSEGSVDFDVDTCFHPQVSDAPTTVAALGELSELVEFDDDEEENRESAWIPEEPLEPPQRSWSINPRHPDLRADTIKAFRELANLKVDGFASLDSDCVPPRRTWKIETKDLARDPEVFAAVQNYLRGLQPNWESDFDDDAADDDVDGLESLDSHYVPPLRTWNTKSQDIGNDPEVLAAVQNYFRRLQSSGEADDEEQ